MWLTILGFFKTGLPFGSISRVLTIILLLTTFSLGILLSVTYGQRNVALSNLQNAASQIKQKDKTIEDKDQEIKTKESEVSGCLGQIQQLNQGIAENALLAVNNEKSGQARAAEQLDKLPSMIDADRKAVATPQITNMWLQELFK